MQTWGNTLHHYAFRHQYTTNDYITTKIYVQQILSSTNPILNKPYVLRRVPNAARYGVGCSPAWLNSSWGNTQAHQRVWMLGSCMVSNPCSTNPMFQVRMFYKPYVQKPYALLAFVAASPRMPKKHLVPPLGQTAVGGTPTHTGGFGC